MPRSTRRFLVLLLAIGVPALGASAQSTSAAGGTTATATATATRGPEYEAVRRAVLDYVEGFYEGDTTKFVRSIRPDVYKYGFWRPRDSTSFQPEQMKWEEFLSYANRVKANKRFAPATAPKEVVVFDLQNMTASAKVTAYWGTDYVLLGNFDGKWMITSVLWQSPPKR